MSGLGSSIYTSFPAEGITNVLHSDSSATPIATRLACTIGPQSSSVEVLSQMLQAGMKIARFDFTTGDLESHLAAYGNLRKAMQATNIMCGVMLNPAGPDIHVINRPGGAIQLSAGQHIKITNIQTVQASATALPVNWTGDFTHTGLSAGSSVFVGQYLFSGAETTSAYLTVQMVEQHTVHCVVNNNCSLEGVHLTAVFNSSRDMMPCLTAADEQKLKAWADETRTADVAGLAAGEFLALPRVHGAADIAACRDMLTRLGLGHMQVVAKIEDLAGLKAHEEILPASDAVLFSRGCLGTYMEPEKVFLAQKMLLHAANSLGKPVFVTRVIDSMTEAPRPTRAEATDMANLVLDGADGVMLGSETFRGKYPVDAVKTVAAICRAAESVFDNYAFYRSMMDSQKDSGLDRSEALASSAVRAAHKMAAKLIVVFTVTGRTARLLAKYKPQQPLLTVVCTDPNSARFGGGSIMGRIDSKEDVIAADSEGSNKRRRGIRLQAGKDLLLSTGPQGSAQATKCLIYRGAQPIMVDAAPGHGADLLTAVLDYAKSAGLVNSGDRVVVSQCPRKINSDTMEEAGVVQLVTVDQQL